MIRYDRNISKRWFVFGLFSGMYDELQDLNYRFLPAAGLGFHAIATNRTTLDLLGGLGYTRESYYNGTVNNLATATIGDEFAYKITKSTTFTRICITCLRSINPSTSPALAKVTPAITA